MRAMTPTALAGHTLAQDIRPDGPTGPTYHVDSKADWVFDASGATEGCNNDSGQANYLRITSTVTSKVVGTRVAPVVMRSIVSPRVGSFADNTGTLTVMVKDQLDRPVPNMPVSISPGAERPKDRTSSAAASLAHPDGGVHRDARPHRLDKRAPPAALRQEHERHQEPDDQRVDDYAPAATIQVRFTTRPSGSATPVASNADALTVSNTKSGDITVQAPAATTPVGTLTVTSLFPYSDGYTRTRGAAGSTTHGSRVPVERELLHLDGLPGFTNVDAPGAGDHRRPPAERQPADRGRRGLGHVGRRVVFTAATTGCSRAPTVATSCANGRHGYLSTATFRSGRTRGASTAPSRREDHADVPQEPGDDHQHQPHRHRDRDQFSLTTSDTRASCAT